ncbi:MAG: DUF4157 domain-containing protein [Proteobacteria bacterium]|nr:DUF4157 domain-containing protein [Pseudomonadota bacterium]
METLSKKQEQLKTSITPLFPQRDPRVSAVVMLYRDELQRREEKKQEKNSVFNGHRNEIINRAINTNPVIQRRARLATRGPNRDFSSEPALGIPIQRQPQIVATVSGYKHYLQSKHAQQPGVSIQPKLEISQPYDPAEIEADSVSEQIMRMPDVSVYGNKSKNLIQRHSNKTIPNQPVSILHRSKGQAGAGASSASKNLASQIQGLSGKGQPLPEKTRTEFEGKFGHSFENVRVHTGSESAGMAQSINAKAFTTGNNIVFGEDQYNTESNEGKKLLAHELTHTVQQNAGDVQRNLNTDDTLSRKIENQVTNENVRTQQNLTDNIRSSQVVQPLSANDRLRQNIDDDATHSQSVENDRNRLRSAGPENVENGANRKTIENQSNQNIGTSSTNLSNQIESDLINQTTGQQNTAQTDADSSSLIRSMTSAAPTEMIQQLSTAGPRVAQARINESKRAASNVPTVLQPTGLPIEQNQNRRQTSIPNTLDTPDLSVQRDTNTRTVSTRHVQSNRPAVTRDSSTVTANNIGQQVNQIPDRDPNLNTSPGAPPSVDLTGAASPTQNIENQRKTDQAVSQASRDATRAINQDFGENDTNPTITRETLKSNNNINTNAEWNGEALSIPDLDDQHRSVYNRQLSEQYDSNIQNELNRQNSAEQEYQTRVDQEQQQGLQRINAETDRVRNEQIQLQQSGQQDIENQRNQWTRENTQVQNNYSSQANAERNRVNQRIDASVTSANRRSREEFTQAEQNAIQQERQAQQQVSTERNHATREKSWFQKATEAIGNFFDNLKKKVNDIFNRLRQAVKDIIERAKNIVKGVIEAARRTIVGFIRSFGEFLKSVVRVALAAFPQIAKRFCALIDNIVERTIQRVNQLAEGLKRACELILDAIGSAIDAYLALYQKAINLILDALKFIAVGIIKILRGLANLGIALGKAITEYFTGAMVEEAIGTDVTKPISVERTDAEIAANSQGQQTSAEQNTGQQNSPTAEERRNNELLNRSELRDSDLVLPDGPGEISPQLLRHLPPIDFGQDIELGSNSNPITRDQLQNAFATGGNDVDGIADSITDSIVADHQSQQDQDQQSNQQPDPDWANMTDDQKLDHYIEQMGKEPPAPEGNQTTQPEQQPDSTNTQDIPYIAKTDRLSVGQRLSFVGRQMMKGMQMWWQKNKLIIYGALAGILIGAGVIAFFTGGAGLIAVLQVLLQIMTVYFIAEAIYRIRGHFMSYLEKAWNGDVEGGGKSLAKALAVLVFEFVFEYLLKVVGKVLKKVKAALKGGKQIGKFGRAVRKVGGFVRKVGTKVRNVGRKIKAVVLRRGKFIFTKLNKAWLKVVNTIGDIREKILKRFGFKRVWIEKSGRYIEVWAEFNPRVMLMKAPVDGEPDLRRVRKVKGRFPINSRKYAGRTVPLEDLPVHLRGKYPHSVHFSGAGYPDFSRYSIKNVRIELGKSRGVDFSRADKAAGFSRNNPRPDDFTWHHHQDSGYMQLVPTDIHDWIKHTGGIATK